MDTIFNYQPTDEELKALFGYDKSRKAMAYGFSIFREPIDQYEKLTTEEEKLFDLAKLFDYRGMRKEANAIWKQIPDVKGQFDRGKDYEQIPD